MKRKLNQLLMHLIIRICYQRHLRNDSFFQGTGRLSKYAKNNWQDINYLHSEKVNLQEKNHRA